MTRFLPVDRDSHASGGGDRRIDPKGLAAHCVQIRKVHQSVVVEVGRAPCGCCAQLRAQFILHGGILREQMEDTGESVGGGVHAGENECPIREDVS